jgi:hypothetical protein
MGKSPSSYVGSSPQAIRYGKRTLISEFKQEGITGTITLPEDELDIFERFVNFLYKENYNDNTKIATATSTRSSTHQTLPGIPQALVLNAKVYVMAEKCDVSELKKLATVKYKAALQNEWNSPALAASLKVLYRETPEKDRLLKDVAMEFIGGHMKDLADRGEFMDLCKERHDFCLDLVKATAFQTLKAWPNCNCNEDVRKVSRQRVRLKGIKSRDYESTGSDDV